MMREIKRRIPWNKGLRGVQVAYNKGLTKETDERVYRQSLTLIGKPSGMKGKTAWNKGKEHSIETKEKISNRLKGRISPRKGVRLTSKTRKKMSLSNLERVKKGVHNFWKGGITSINALIRGGIEYRFWRESVFKRDKFTCQKCGVKSQKGQRVYLEAHHIKSFAEFVDLRFDVDNGLTLCKECHRKDKNRGRKAA